MRQTTALKILKSGANVFLTGQAGAGKTYTLNQYIKYLHAKDVPVAVTATTGIAATHIGGATIHSWAGIGIKRKLTEKEFHILLNAEHVYERVCHARVLIIDEISMMHAHTLRLVDEVLRRLRKNPLPFGGVQVVFCGDFFQLPPVGSEPNYEKYAFMSQSWVDASPVVCYLSEQHRQQESGDGITLNHILNQIRQGKVDDSARNALRATRTQDIGEAYTQLYTHNADVDHINQEALNTLTTPIKQYEGRAFGNEKMQAMLMKSVRAPQYLQLKQGAKVMLVRNIPELGVYNGTMAIVTGFSENGLPCVTLESNRTIEVDYESWSILDENNQVLAEYVQIPLCLAWAISVHKSQGMTLSAAKIDLGRTFEHGQGYVALSRLRTLAGLRLISFNEISLELDPLAMRADARFLQLSSEAEARALQGDFTPIEFVLDEPYPKDDVKDIVEPVGATIAKSIALLRTSDSSIEKTAQARTLKPATIIGHLIKHIERHPDEADDFSHLIDNKIVEEVGDAMYFMQTQSQIESPDLKDLYIYLQKKYDYAVLDLARAFWLANKDA